MLVVGFIFTFLMVAQLETPTYDLSELDIDCIVVEPADWEDVDEYGKPRCMVDDDFGRDVYDCMRDPDIEFPPKKED